MKQVLSIAVLLLLCAPALAGGKQSKTDKKIEWLANLYLRMDAVRLRHNPAAIIQEYKDLKAIVERQPDSLQKRRNLKELNDSFALWMKPLSLEEARQQARTVVADMEANKKRERRNR